MKKCARVRSRVARLMMAATLVMVCAAGSAAAQAPPAPAEPAPAAAPPEQAPAAPPAPTPQEIAAKQDSATLDFFRRTEVSGFVDGYYTYNFNTPAKACTTSGGVAVFNCLYNFNVAHNSFTMSLAKLALEKKPTSDNRGGFRVDFVYGPATAIVHSLEPTGAATSGIYQNIEQAYLSYLAPAGTGLQLDFGKFVTPIGNEVIESKDNWNYSRGLLFSWAIPYYHVGARAAYNINDQVSVTGFLLNGWNNAVDNNKGKTIAGQLTIKPNADLTLLTNYMGGPEAPNQPSGSNWRHLSDTVVTYNVNKQVSVAANYDYAKDNVGGVTATWQGIAGYVKFQPTDMFALTPRVEYFNDKDGAATGTPQKLKEVTITAEVKSPEGVIMRLEYRGDVSDQNFFTKNTSQPSKNQSTFTIAFIYAFTTKAQ
jgi:putative OmpL-like beta-barrel porin-2